MELRAGDTLILGERIRVKLEEKSGSAARLVIDVPAEVTVLKARPGQVTIPINTPTIATKRAIGQ